MFSFLKSKRHELKVDNGTLSTRQSIALDPLLISTPPYTKDILGIDRITRQIITHNPFELYKQKIITSPNITILGNIGVGKSALVKSHYVIRALLSNIKMLVFDKKRQGQEGEYTKVAEYFNIKPIKLGVEGINIFDKSISKDPKKPVNQQKLLNILMKYVCSTYDNVDQGMVTSAYNIVNNKHEEIRIDHIIEVFKDKEFFPDIPSIKKINIRLGLERFVTGDLSGLLDYNSKIDWTQKLIIIDTSLLPEYDIVLDMMMNVVISFINGIWSNLSGQKYLILEEGYYTTRLSISSLLRSFVKRGRGLGVGVITVLHHIDDILESSDSMSLVKESDIVHIYRQTIDIHINQVINFFQLPEVYRTVLPQLNERGEHILKINNLPVRRVLHIMSDKELELTYTDNKME